MRVAGAGTRLAPLSRMEEPRPARPADDADPDEPPVRRVPRAAPISRMRLAEGTGPLADHQVLVSAALVAEEAEAELHRSVGLRQLPPARFLRPVRLPVDEPARRPRRAIGLLAAALALGSLAIAGYWLVAT